VDKITKSFDRNMNKAIMSFVGLFILVVVLLFVCFLSYFVHAIFGWAFGVVLFCVFCVLCWYFLKTVLLLLKTFVEIDGMTIVKFT